MDSLRPTALLIKERRENDGGEIAAVVAEEAFDYLNASIKRVAALFTPVPFSPVLESEFIPNEAKIITAV